MILLYPINYGTTKISTLLPRVFKTLLAEPDLIQDLLPPMARRVARSTSFSQGEYSRWRRDGDVRKINKTDNAVTEHRLEKKSRMVKRSVKRSVSAVTEIFRPHQRLGLQ